MPSQSSVSLLCSFSLFPFFVVTCTALYAALTYLWLWPLFNRLSTECRTVDFAYTATSTTHTNKRAHTNRQTIIVISGEKLTKSHRQQKENKKQLNSKKSIWIRKLCTHTFAVTVASVGLLVGCLLARLVCYLSVMTVAHFGFVRNFCFRRCVFNTIFPSSLDRSSLSVFTVFQHVFVVARLCKLKLITINAA